MRAVAALCVLGGCWRTPVVEEPPVANAAPEPPRVAMVITQDGAGPFNAQTIATLPALRKLVPTLRVVERDLGGESGIVFDIFDGRDKLFYVVPDDAPGWTDDAGEEHRYADTMFAVFAISPRVRVQGRTWRVGKPFENVGDLDRCECWGGGEVTACYRGGSRIRIIFERECAEAEAVGPGAMLGMPIDRIMWKREPEHLFEPVAP